MEEYIVGELRTVRTAFGKLRDEEDAGKCVGRVKLGGGEEARGFDDFISTRKVDSGR